MSVGLRDWWVRHRVGKPSSVLEGSVSLPRRLLRWTPETPLRREDINADASGFLITYSAPRGLESLPSAR